MRGVPLATAAANNLSNPANWYVSNASGGGPSSINAAAGSASVAGDGSGPDYGGVVVLSGPGAGTYRIEFTRDNLSASVSTYRDGLNDGIGSSGTAYVRRDITIADGQSIFIGSYSTSAVTFQNVVITRIA